MSLSWNTESYQLFFPQKRQSDLAILLWWCRCLIRNQVRVLCSYGILSWRLVFRWCRFATSWFCDWRFGRFPRLWQILPGLCLGCNPYVRCTEGEPCSVWGIPGIPEYDVTPKGESSGHSSSGISAPERIAFYADTECFFVSEDEGNCSC